MLAAACPEKAPFMADECLLAIPDIEGIDYTTKEYLKFTNHIQAVSDRLNKEAVKDKILKNNCAVADGDEKKSDVGATDTDDGVVAEENAVFVWSPHKVEMALWTYYIVSDMKPELLSSKYLFLIDSNKTLIIICILIRCFDREWQFVVIFINPSSSSSFESSSEWRFIRHNHIGGW